MRGPTRHAAFAVFTAIACALLFSIAMLLRYRVYRDSTTSLTSTDMVPITKRVSSVWCSSQTLSAKGNSTIQVYLVPEEPQVIPGGPQRTFLHHSELKVATVEYWGFYLLKGSHVNVSTCARLPGATLTVIRGQRTLSECLRRFHRLQKGDTSEESEESAGDDEGPSSSISSSEGVFTAEATEEGAFHCPNKAVFHSELKAAFSCSKDLIDKGRLLRYLDQVSLSSDQSDFYYIVFSTGAILDLIPNQVHWSIALDRTTLDLSSSLQNCSTGPCDMPLAFASAHYSVVHLADDVNSSEPLSDVIVSTCEPRKGLYFVFFLLIFLAIGICAFQ